MQDRLGLLQRLGAIPELQPVNCAGGSQGSDPSQTQEQAAIDAGQIQAIGIRYTATRA
jgi:hypothetical protein